MPITASVLTPQLAAWKLSIDSRLQQICQGPDSLHHTILALIESGSRVRSLLFLSIVEGLGGHPQAFFDVACALEMAHLYGLSIFTLPCQRHDDDRPIKLAASQKWGEALTLLAGDALLAQSMDLLASQEHVTHAVRLELISRLAKAVGPQGMLAGQAASLMFPGTECSSQALWEMHRLKSGSLLRCCMEMAPIVCHASQVVVKRLGQTGEELGIALALLDDLAAEEGLLGLGKLMGERKTSTIRTLGIALSRSQALQILQHARQRLHDELRHPEAALLVIERLVHRSADAHDGEKRSR